MSNSFGQGYDFFSLELVSALYYVPHIPPRVDKFYRCVSYWEAFKYEEIVVNLMLG